MKPTQVRVDATVSCPEDRGEKSYKGQVLSVQPEVHKNHQGIEYVWVEVRHPSGSKHIWPSSRLQ
jgi:hypothetical protein